MFNRILVFLLLLSVSLNLAAKDPFKSTTHIGFQGGVNYSRVAFNPSITESLLTSQEYGLVFRHISEPNIGIQLEVNYSGKGWKENLDSVGTYTRKLQTIDVPVMAAFIIGSKLVRFPFTIGSYVSYLRDEKEVIKIPNTADYRDYYTKPLQHKWEFGLIVGLGMEFHTKFGVLGAKASFSHGLTNLFPTNDKVFYNDGSRNQVLNASLCYMISF
jgi:hypothetical protein